jgi:hypothetical protein
MEHCLTLRSVLGSERSRGLIAFGAKQDGFLPGRHDRGVILPSEASVFVQKRWEELERLSNDSTFKIEAILPDIIDADSSRGEVTVPQGSQCITVFCSDFSDLHPWLCDHIAVDSGFPVMLVVGKTPQPTNPASFSNSNASATPTPTAAPASSTSSTPAPYADGVTLDKPAEQVATKVSEKKKGKREDRMYQSHASTSIPTSSSRKILPRCSLTVKVRVRSISSIESDLNHRRYARWNPSIPLMIKAPTSPYTKTWNSASIAQRPFKTYTVAFRQRRTPATSESTN